MRDEHSAREHRLGQCSVQQVVARYTPALRPDGADYADADLGGIRTTRATEAAILFVPHVIRSSGFAPFAISAAR